MEPLSIKSNAPEVRLFEGMNAAVITPAVMPIRTGAAPAPATAKPNGTGYICPFANAAANSRSSFGLTKGELKPRWSTDLPPSLNPRFVLQDRDRILLYGSEWILLDMQGRTVTYGFAAGGPPVLDMVHGLFYRMISSGHMAAARTADGSLRFTHLPSHGDVFSRRLIVRRGDRILIAGNERDLKPRDTGPPGPMRSTVDAVDVAEPIKTSPMGTLLPGSPEKTLYLPTEKVLFAATDQLVAAAAPGRIYIIDWNLQTPRTLEASFEPVAMSLDEAGRIYLVVRREGKKDALWLLTQEGERLYSFKLPEGVSSFSVPPVIGYDHTAYVFAGRPDDGQWQIFAIASDGKLKWSQTAGGLIAGAVVTADGYLLVSEGSDVAAYDTHGTRNVLFSFPGEELCTPTVLAGNGEMLVSTRERLYCLALGSG